MNTIQKEANKIINISKIMYISELVVINFRSIEKETFFFTPFSILIGKNNAGKSNIIAALRFLLEATNKDISQRDFHNVSDDIIFEAKIQNVEGFLDLSAEPHRVKIKEDVKDGYLKIRRIIKPGPDVDKLKIFNINKKEYELKTGIENALKQLLPEVIFIEAFQDPSLEAQGKSTATLGKIIKQILSRIQEKTSKQIEGAFKNADALLNIIEKEVDGKIQEVDNRTEDIKNIEQKIRKNLQHVFENIDVRIKIDFPKIPELMVNSRIELFDSGSWTPPNLTGQGVQRALYVALLRSLAEQLREEKNIEGNIKRPFLLLIEEPEIFLHPSILGTMRNAIEDISDANQVVIATHCPNMISRTNLSNVILIRKLSKRDRKGTTVKLNKNNNQIKEVNEKRILHLLDYQRSSKFFFADKIIVVEGSSDVVLLEAILETWSQQSLDSLGIAIIESWNKDVVVECTDILKDIGLDAICVLDIDFLWNGAGKICKDKTYSQFVDNFWNKAKDEGIIKKDDKGGQKIVKDKKKAAEIIECQFKETRDDILGQLRTSKIWVLSQGEIEHYVGLSSSSKGHYLEVAKKIREKKQTIEHESELRKIFEEGAGVKFIT